MKRLLLYAFFALFVGLCAAELATVWQTEWNQDPGGVTAVRDLTAPATTQTPTTPKVDPADILKMIEEQNADH